MTIQGAAQASGWSPRMLRYIEQAGLLRPSRTESGYRDYSAEDVARLRTLKDLSTGFGLGVAELAFTVRLATEPKLRTAVGSWLEPRRDVPNAGTV